MYANEFFNKALALNASDIFCVAGLPICYKTNNRIVRDETGVMMPENTMDFIRQIYTLSNNRDMEYVLKHGEDDFSFSIPGLSRFRVNIYKQRNSLAAVIRVITFSLPDPDSIGIPENVMSLAKLTNGLFIVTGPAGSGKSTTLACIIDAINSTRNDHIITLEDPIEYPHRHKKSIVSQREIGIDTESFVVALRASLRQAPDVILLGEMRDFETIRTAMTAAETGHLVISTLHTTGAANTVDRVIDAFPPNQQQQIRIQLSMVLKAVVSQQLVKSTSGELVPAFEVMRVNTAISNMIRDSKIHQIDSVILSSAQEGMNSMDSSLIGLYQSGKISLDTAVYHSTNREQMQKRLNRI